MFARAPTTVRCLPLPVRRFSGMGTCMPAGEIRPGERIRVGQDVLHRAFGDHPPAVLARARAQVDDPIGRADGLVIMLDDQHGVAQVAQALRACSAGGRYRAGAGRWRARPARTARPSAASRSASPGGCAAPRRRRAMPAERLQGQVIQAHIDQEAQARAGSPSGCARRWPAGAR